MSDAHPYLGKNLPPELYYRRHAREYHNPHADGIERLLLPLARRLASPVLDLGCGDGLATKLLADRGLAWVGVDRSKEMVRRYEAETGFPGHVATFADPLPEAASIVSLYALHLATPAEASVMWWRMWETGARHVVVVTPFKQRPEDPGHYFRLLESTSGPYGPDGKAIHAKVYVREDAA